MGMVTRLIQGAALLPLLLLAPACDDDAGSRFPLNAEVKWDPNLPPAVSWDYGTPITANDNLTAGFRLRAADGKLLTFSVQTSDRAAWLCVAEGLQPDTVYTWTVGPFGEDWHQSLIPEHAEAGTWTFRTSTETAHPPPGEDCALPDVDAYRAESATIDTNELFDDDDASADDGPTFGVTWEPEAVVLTIANADAGGDHWFGLAETGCKDTIYCWYGEDCIYGFGEYFYCHPSSPTGVSLRYDADIDTMEEGVETLFTNDSFAGTVTYYLESPSGCWVWGHDPSYYAGLGCQE